MAISQLNQLPVFSADEKFEVSLILTKARAWDIFAGRLRDYRDQSHPSHSLHLREVQRMMDRLVAGTYTEEDLS